MKAKKKRILIIVSALLLVAVLAGVGTIIYQNAFAPVGGGSCNLSDAAALAEVADYLHAQEAKDTLAKKLKAMQRRLDVASLDFHGIKYYLTICNRLSLDVDIAGAKAALSKYYITDTCLFSFGLDENDGVNDAMDAEMNRDLPVVLTLTINMVQAYPAILDWEEFSLRRGIADAIANMEYALPAEDGSVSLYNAGWIAVFTIYTLRQIDGTDYAPYLPDGTDEWYQAWKNYFWNQPVLTRSLTGFYPIAMVMEGECPVTEIQSYYESWSLKEIAQCGSLNTFLSVLRLVDADKNPAFMEAFRSSMMEEIENYQFLRKY